MLFLREFPQQLQAFPILSQADQSLLSQADPSLSLGHDPPFTSLPFPEVEATEREVAASAVETHPLPATDAPDTEVTPLGTMIWPFPETLPKLKSPPAQFVTV